MSTFADTFLKDLEDLSADENEVQEESKLSQDEDMS